MKIRGWKCRDESVRMKVRGWKCKDEISEDEISKDEKSEDEKAEDENARMKLRGWSVTQPFHHIKARKGRRQMTTILWWSCWWFIGYRSHCCQITCSWRTWRWNRCCCCSSTQTTTSSSFILMFTSSRTWTGPWRSQKFTSCFIFP